MPIPQLPSTQHSPSVDMQDNQKVVDEWSHAAPFWEKHRDLIGLMFAPVTEALVRAAEIGNGDRVLDVATGPGDPAISLVQIVGARGWVDGIDPVAAMVAAARREADRLNLRNIRFAVASGEQLPFSSESFDAAVSRFGVMFFPEPVAGIREMLRVLKPEARVALAVWRLLERNPFFSVVERILEDYIVMLPSDPDSPNSFRFATSGKLCDVLQQAGVSAPEEQVIRFDMRVPVSPDDFWTLRCEMSDKLRGMLGKLTAAQLVEVRARSLQAALAWRDGAEFRFPAEVLIVRGAKQST